MVRHFTNRLRPYSRTLDQPEKSLTRITTLTFKVEHFMVPQFTNRPRPYSKTLDQPEKRLPGFTTLNHFPFQWSTLWCHNLRIGPNLTHKHQTSLRKLAKFNYSNHFPFQWSTLWCHNLRIGLNLTHKHLDQPEKTYQVYLLKPFSINEEHFTMPHFTSIKLA